MQHGGRCRTRFTATEGPKPTCGRVDESGLYMGGEGITTAYVSTGPLPLAQLHTNARHSSPIMPPQIPIHRLSLSPALKNLRVTSAQKRVANLSSIQNATVEEVLVFHEDPERPVLHASTRTSPRRKSGTTNHRHVCQCSIPRQRRPVPLLDFRSSCVPVAERMCLA